MHFILMYVHLIFVHCQYFQQLFVCCVYFVGKSNGSSQINHLTPEKKKSTEGQLKKKNPETFFFFF